MNNGSPKGQIIKVKFPAVASGGKCPSCQHNLDEYIEAYKRDKIELPACCPNCGQHFALDGITRFVTRCGRCQEEILHPGTQKFCTNCRCEIVYPEEPGYQELLEKVEKKLAQATKEGE